MWNDIELLTNDDTGSGYLSVGSRKEHGTALYQVDLLAKISSEKASLNPKIQACSLSDGFIIVADQSVILLDSICRSLQLYLIFDTEVDVVGLCQEGKFLFVGERSGNLHFIHVTSKQTLLTTAFVQKANDENECTYRTLVIEKDGSSEGTYYMLLLTNNGFFCITNLQLVKIQQAIENVDFNKAKKLQEQIKSTFISTENYHTLGCLNLVAGDLASKVPMIIGGTGNCAFSKWEPDPFKKEMIVKNVMDAEIIKGARKFQLIDNLLFVLDTDNVLSLWDIYTLTPIWNWPSLHVEEFLLTTEADPASSVTWQGITNLKLVALTTTTNKVKNLMVYSLPMMEILYSLEVSSVSSLVQAGISTDTIYLLEGICKNDPKPPEDSVSVLVLRCLTEALPENRLSRLLHKHRFAEAESFAIQFGLDVELVYKVKSNDILEKLALSSVDTSEQTKWQKLVDEAKENLHKIQDDEFVVNYCLEAQWITYETTQEMLNYAKTRLLKKEDKIVPVYSYGLKEVLRAHAKLTTFYGAFGPEKFSGSSWIEFLNNEDDLKDIFLQLREGNLVCAQYLWLRHRANFESRFDVKMLENLLNSISTPVSLQKLCPWLKNDVIPFVRRTVPAGQGEDCVLLLRSLPPAEAVKTAERVIIWARLALQEEPDNSKEDKAWRMSVVKTSVDILKMLCNIQKDNPQKKDECGENLKLFKAVASLQENCEVFLSFGDYSNRSLLAELREQYIKAQEVAQAKHQPQSTEQKTLSPESRLHRQALALHVSPPELEAELTLRALNDGNMETALRKCRDLYKYHCNADTGILLFLTCQKLCQMLANDVPMTTPVGLHLPSIIHELACQAATICSPDILLDVLELCKYTLTAVELSRQCQMDDCGILAKTSFGTHKDPYEEWSFSDFFSEDGIVLESQMVLPVIYELISSLVPLAESKRHPLDSTSLPYCSISEGASLILPSINSISALLQNLQESSQWELALRFVVCSFGTCLQYSVSNFMDVSLSEKLFGKTTLVKSKQVIMVLKEKAVTFVRANATTLLHKVFNCRLVDLDLALGYCTLLPQKEVFENLWKLIDKAWQNYDKILAISLVGSQLASLYQETEMVFKFRELSTDAQWGIRLGKLGISFQPVFRQHFLTKKDLIKALVENIDMDTSLILEYCSTFQLNCDAALQLFIETLLHNTNTSHGQGDASSASAKQQHSKLLAKALEMVPLLTSTKDLVISLSGILHKLDPYDYEMIEIVLKVIERADEKITNININQALSLLKHLKSYRRISPPVDLENQYMLEHVITLPSAAQTRLPFHLIFFGTAQNFWKILSTELSEESFPTLLLISKLMKFSLDTLYVSTAKHVFEKKLKPKLLKLPQAKSSTLINKEITKITQTIESYLLSIVNPEWAIAIAISLAQDIPEGSFKMPSLKFCLYLAERWLQNIPSEDETREKAEALLKKLHIQYRRSGTEAVLIAHKLNTAEYLRMIGKPAHLIISLYEHPSINQRIQNSAGKDYPDIHAAAKEIAEVNEIDLEKVWNMLLEQWLCPSTKPGENSSEIFELQEDEALRRVLYLLLSRPIDYSSRMLFIFATSPTPTAGVRQLTFAHRTRALQCLLYLADKETIESLFKKPIEEVKAYLKCITFLASFETLNIPITYELFCNSPKEGMIKGLWKNHSHESMAVRLVTELCLEYKIYDLQLWNGLLQKLLGFNMIPYLRKVLTAICSIHSLWQVPYFSKAWQRVVQIPLLSASCPLSPSQLSDCCESLVAILECPVSDALDMIGVARQYAQLELPAFALACFMLMPHSEQRSQHIKNFLSSCDPKIILQQLEEHMNTGQLAGFSHQVRNLILNNIINKKEFGNLAKTKYFQALKLHMMNANNVTDLVNYLADESSLDEASVFITEYSKHCGKPVPPDATPCEILKMFLNGS
ncbi:kinetochore-associated protein 1 isoform 2-T2 [Hipposideros larvatus]